MKTVITAIVALVIGAAGGYFYAQNDVTTLQGALDAAKQSMESAKQKAEETMGELTASKEESATTIKTLEDELAAAKQQAEESMSKVSDLEARIQELEAAQQSSQ
ncbi:hypothetical protein [Salaquimonas pukyongi]|uniref:hypothetical protein n=1 Tax=Salaquimonas pukyongi TaxID=2712698 RepID=UPI00096B792B|nr:hypothetical protein [Salaquimonas pukyongi]